MNTSLASNSNPVLSGAALSIAWENHPANARNWSKHRKLYTTFIISLIGFISTMATSIYSPGHENVAIEFGVSSTLALLPLSTYALGMGFGPVVASPLSETFGRKIVYLTAVPIFAIFVLGSGLSRSLWSLCICRFFSGVFGAPGVSIATATIADINPPNERGTPLAVYYTIPFIGSLIGPMVGGPIVEWKGWRWTQWATLCLVAAVFPLLGFVRESHRGAILKRLGRKVHTEHSVALLSPSAFRHFLTVTISRPIHMLFTEPIVGLVCLYCSFQFALLYTFIVGSPYVFATIYDFSIGQQSLSFFGLITGAAMASVILITLDHVIYRPRYCRFRSTLPNGEFPPEHRLYSSMIGSLLIPIGLFAFAWTARPTIHWVVPLIAQGLTMVGSVLTYVGANMYMVDTYGPMYSASAAGANSIARYLLTASFPLFTVQMYQKLGTSWTASLLGFCTVAMTPIPWFFWKWGAKLRGRSRYEKEM